MPLVLEYLDFISVEQNETNIVIIGQKKNIHQHISNRVLLRSFDVGIAQEMTSVNITGSGLMDRPHWLYKVLKNLTNCAHKIICNQFKVSLIMDDKKNEQALALKKAIKLALEAQFS